MNEEQIELPLDNSPSLKHEEQPELPLDHEPCLNYRCTTKWTL